MMRGSSVVGWCRLSVGYRERRPKVRTGNAERTTAAAPAYTTLDPHFQSRSAIRAPHQLGSRTCTQTGPQGSA
ncbi:hypothetical protein PC116_g6983 [Phytophthora cactorum]|nr:hypothetical protein PC114_g4651 [Phytophthora cactorum]KAG3031949.1 hypothetical protein PC120_g2808 [Phytophthora cactorum]KAG3037000.1 hypothetical protein PC119_g3992 [Phytophthora cactorum]KAG3186309.1 hypothetical protein C6341_g3926 [Phytophthora cactorum]KAG3199658.1 hypothetical protein PC128_g5156 [Phytophthora cactorum]